MFLAAMFLSCTIPVNLVIQSQDPCRVYERIKTEFQEADGRRWFVLWTRDTPFTKLSLEEMGLLVVVERPSVFQTPCGPALGSFTPGLNLPSIQFSAEHEFGGWRVLAHEMGHWIGWKTDMEGWKELGHGTERDPLILAIKSWEKYLWPIPESHPFWPGNLPVAKAPGSGGGQPTPGVPGCLAAPETEVFTPVKE